MLRRNASKRQGNTTNRRLRSALRAGLRHRVQRSRDVLKLREANRGISLHRSVPNLLVQMLRGMNLSTILRRQETHRPAMRDRVVVPVMDRGTEILTRDLIMTGIVHRVRNPTVHATIVLPCSSPHDRAAITIRDPVIGRRMSGRIGTGGTTRIGERRSLERMVGGVHGVGMRRTLIALSRRRSLSLRVSPFRHRQGMIQRMSRTSRMALTAQSASN